MSRKDFDRMSQEIKESVEKVMDSIPYDEIGKKVSEGVERAGQKIREELTSDEKRRHVKPPRGKKKSKDKKRDASAGAYEDIRWQEENRWQEAAGRRQNETKKNGFFRKKQQKEEDTPEAEMFARKPKGRISWFFCLFIGLLLTCSVAVGWGLMGLLNLLDLSYMQFFAVEYVWMFPVFAVGVYLTLQGTGIRGRLKRFSLYRRHLKGKEYCQLEVLEKTTGRSVRYLKKDLKKMIALGMFPHGHLDEGGTCLMLTTRAYDQYLMMVEAQEKQKREAEEEALKKAEEEKKRQEEESQRFADVDEQQRSEIIKVIREGELYLKRFESISERLAGEDMNKKLSRLSLVTGRIFEFITDHPNKVGEIKKFMSYYLPTTEKLLNTYEELDKEPVQGENITKAKKEILDTLDTINYAFENLLDSLYEDTMMDISTDIAVLETMLAQEGLVDQEF